MDGVDCDWCLVCDKRTSSGATYCSPECRSTDLISSSVSSSSSSSTFSMTDPQGIPLPGATSSPLSPVSDHYSMPPFVRKQRTSIPNIYAHCTSNPNPPSHLYLSQHGAGSSALQQSSTAPSAIQMQMHQQHQQKDPLQGSAAAQYPLFYATLSALRPVSPSGPTQQDP
ncbi:hypothetical protein B0O80DRAFT_429110 [Mortierella sp. GBAus27b]|nr:hypothetical protein B0O80DRAFT_429110 [Mortierella sp. GBAus27b]